eukprot:4185184-Pleurochrysis_carterae.AAC.2
MARQAGSIRRRFLYANWRARDVTPMKRIERGNREMLSRLRAPARRKICDAAGGNGAHEMKLKARQCRLGKSKPWTYIWLARSDDLTRGEHIAVKGRRDGYHRWLFNGRT